MDPILNWPNTRMTNTGKAFSLALISGFGLLMKLRLNLLPVAVMDHILVLSTLEKERSIWLSVHHPSLSEARTGARGRN